MPAFAIGRTQEVIWVLDDLVAIRPHPAHAAVPRLADGVAGDRRSTTTIPRPTTRRPAELLRSGDSPLRYPGQQFTDTVEESKAIRHANRPIMVVAASGMLTGGRIMHHLKDFLPDPTCTLLFIGYQGEGTLGRHLQDGGKTARIDGQEFDGPLPRPIDQRLQRACRPARARGVAGPLRPRGGRGGRPAEDRCSSSTATPMRPRPSRRASGPSSGWTPTSRSTARP